MKHTRSLALLLLTLACVPFAATSQTTDPTTPKSEAPLKVLFIGNSYTYYNNLSAIVAAFAAAAPDSKRIEPKDHTMGAATLSKIWDLRATPYVLALEKWNFVVLQEHSYAPISAPERMYEVARKFDLAGKEVGAKTVMYLTWSRRASPDDQSLLNASYSSVATRLGALIAPVGPAWKIALELDPKLSLYANDGSHPSPTGSYIAGCALYLVLSGSQQPCPPLTLAGVTAEQANVGRAAALQAVTAWRKL